MVSIPWVTVDLDILYSVYKKSSRQKLNQQFRKKGDYIWQPSYPELFGGPLFLLTGATHVEL